MVVGSTWKMKFTSFVVVLLFVGLVLAQDDSETFEKQCSPDLCALVKELSFMRKQLSVMATRLNESETRLKQSENQILELKNKETTKVIFSAAIGGGDGAVGPFNTLTTLIYRTVRTNIGNAYSPSTGIFTAPVSGVYYFTIFFHAGGHRKVDLHLYKNNQMMIVTKDHQSGADTADNGGNAVFLQLQQGDRVYVGMVANSHVYGTDYVTTFSGFLVTQM